LGRLPYRFSPQGLSGRQGRKARGQISRHEIHGAFDALEVTANGAGESAEDGCLSNTHIAFEQHMAARK
jgi:hypothetical protein